MDMIERVAHAILAAHDHTTNDGNQGGFYTMTDAWQEVYRAMARAAIEAMREPTTEMGNAAVTDYNDHNAFDIGDACDAWQAMITAALETSK